MYTYESLMDDVNYLAYNSVETGSIGKSLMGNFIPYLHIGDKSGKQIIITGGIHARENVTSLLVMRQVFALYGGKTVPSGGIFFVPMVNPDGAILLEQGANAFPSRRETLLKINNGNEDFSQWKANAAGVDLNTNFDAEWGSGAYNKNSPSSDGYVGEHPFSEPETRALRDFTLDVSPALTISYHAAGREIYWQFDGERGRIVSQLVGKELGYKVVDGKLMSAGGYKDWCVLKLKIPALTIEIGESKYSHPLKEEQVKEDFAINLDLPIKLLEMI